MSNKDYFRMRPDMADLAYGSSMRMTHQHNAILELYELVEKQAERIQAMESQLSLERFLMERLESLERSREHQARLILQIIDNVNHDGEFMLLVLRHLGVDDLKIRELLEEVKELQKVISARTIVSVAFEFSGETDMSTINVTVNVTRASGATGPLLASDNVTIAVTSGSSVYAPNADPSTGVLSGENPGENETLTATAADGTVLGTGTVGWGVPPDPVSSVNFAFEEVQ